MAAALATEAPATLTASERRRLAELEAVVKDGLPVFLRVGAALAEIHGRKLYRASHRSFEAYLAERFQMSRPRAHELITASKVAEAIAGAGEAPRASERALREVAPVLRAAGPEAAAQAWQAIVEEVGPEPAAADVRALLRKRRMPGLPNRAPLDEAGRLLTSVGRYVERYGTTPLEPALRPVATKYARRSRILALALDRLAAGERVPAGMLTDAPKPGTVWCDHHGELRDADGVCRFCGVEDLPSKR